MIKMYLNFFLRLLCIFLLTFYLYGCQKRDSFKNYSYNGDDEEISIFERLLLNNRSDLALQYAIDNDLADRLKNYENIGYWIVYYWDNNMNELAEYLLLHGVILSKEFPLLHMAVENLNYDAFVWLYSQGFDINKKYRYGKLVDSTSATEYITYIKLQLIGYNDDSEEYKESPELQQIKMFEKFIRNNNW